MQMKKSEVAVSGPDLAMEIVPSLWRMPVTLVRSSGMAETRSVLRAGSIPA